jgi:hypothetical protein
MDRRVVIKRLFHRRFDQTDVIGAPLESVKVTDRAHLDVRTTPPAKADLSPTGLRGDAIDQGQRRRPEPTVTSNLNNEIKPRQKRATGLDIGTQAARLCRGHWGEVRVRGSFGLGPLNDIARNVGDQLRAKHQLIKSRPLGLGNLKNQHRSIEPGQSDSKRNYRSTVTRWYGSKAFVTKPVEEVWDELRPAIRQTRFGRFPIGERRPHPSVETAADSGLCATQ